MTTRDLLSEVSSSPAGATFHKCALQVNPADYAAKYRGSDSPPDEQRYARDLIEKAIELDISVLGVTDHNHVRGIVPIRAEARRRGITVFPGFELTTSEGVHVLCLYSPDTNLDKLERYLGEFGIRETEQSTTLSTLGFSELLLRARDQGGLTIAAHVTNEKGLLRVLKGGARIKAWRDPNLLAIQIPGPLSDLPEDLQQIVSNRDVNYVRPLPASPDQAIAVVNARDVASPADLSDPATTCFIKMSEITIEGLKQAFLDPSSRIRLNSDESPEDHAELIAIGWEGGFLDGVVLPLNQNLNVLIGGRGSGKSTVIESLRYVLGLEPLGEDAREAHEGFVKYVLRGGTKISVLARTYRPLARTYRIERTVPNPPIVRDENGAVSNLVPLEVLPRIEVFGQHEISELAKSREKLTRLLDRFVERDPQGQSDKARLRSGLEKNRRQLLDAEDEHTSISERLASLPALEETLARFQEAGLEERLREQSLLLREERILQSAGERIEPFRELASNFDSLLPIDTVFVSPSALEELPNEDVLSELMGVLSSLEQELLALLASFGEAIERANAAADLVSSRWNLRSEDAAARYEKILRELQKSKVDGQEFIQLRRQIEDLRPLRERLGLLEQVAGEHADRRRTLLASWEDTKAAEFRLLDSAAKRVSRELRDRVRVTVTAAGNREQLETLLRAEVGGRLSEAIEILQTVDGLSLTEFVEACRDSPNALITKYRIARRQAERLCQASRETLMRIEELDLPATTEIELNTAAADTPASWQKLKQLSTGQKSTAVLLLLLLESDSPLIVDQPEDDLDNRFIAEGVVPAMRKEKRRRQFIFSTHNANIPVLGDAELIAGLTAAGEAEFGTAQVRSDHLGSIDSKTVRELVEEVLEGGKEAFETRRLKYGF